MTGRDFLFATFEGGGNLPPVLSVAGALRARGHRVRILADSLHAEEIAHAGCEHVKWTTAPNRTSRAKEDDILRDFEVPPGPARFQRLVDRILCGPAAKYARDTLAEIDRARPDVAVIDSFVLGAHAAAESRRIPTAVLVPNVYMFPAPGLPPFGMGLRPARGPVGWVRDRALGWLGDRLWNGGLPALNAARAELGLAPLRATLDQPRRAERLLVLTSKAFDFEAKELPANVRYVGPRLADPTWIDEWTAPWPEDGTPVVLVAMSTTFQDQETALRRAIAAVGSLPVRAVVTLGPTLDPASFEAPANVAVVRSAPHAPILRRAAACLTHAGHGTLIKSLAAGVPVVCMPMGRDQDDNAARVSVRGAGLHVKPDAPEAAIRAALGRVLDEASFRESARRIARAIEAETAHDHAVAEIESLLPAPARQLATAS